MREGRREKGRRGEAYLRARFLCRRELPALHVAASLEGSAEEKYPLG